MIKLYKQCGVALGCALLLFLHFYRLGEVPGLHFDEAWAMGHAWRITHERGYWPLTAMSPYTAPWAHYWGALWMRVLGPSLIVFRASQITLALGGMLALAFALPRHLRAGFPWAALLLPGLLLNQRFAIELTGFHALCFGVLCWALRERWYGFACVAALLGTTAHILFYGVALGILGMVLLERLPLSKRARAWAIAYFILMSLFFLRVLLEIPEKGKAGALVLSAVALACLLALRGETAKIWKKGAWLVPIASAAFVFNSVFFAQGVWGAQLFTGHQLSLAEEGLFWLGFLGLGILFVRALMASPRSAARAFALITLTFGVLMLKPAPRYFEIPFLAMAALLCWEFWGPRPRRLAALSGLLAINLGLSFSLLFLIPPVESSLHFLFFRDSSRDFLDTQSLARFLGSSGCKLGDIRSNDPRLALELATLSIGDWPVDPSQHCGWYNIARRTEPGAIGERFGEFLLQKVR
ncbi:MAG: hypothetical protein ACXVB9_18145 [Bdellovibrionota bacterium]